MDFVGSHILSVAQFSRLDVERIFAVADLMVPFANRRRITSVLEGAILSNMFFEPSTRTRVSFGCAFNRLGGDVRETTEVKASAIAKGESLHDFARVLSGYSDIIVMRHSTEGSVAEFSETSRVPVINGGDGANEHPSQALLDLYTIQKELASTQKGIDGIRIAVVGDLKNGRALHSLLKLLSVFNNLQIHLVSPPNLETPEDIVQILHDRNHRVEVFHNLTEGIEHVDILYVTRTQEERFESQQDADRYRGLFRINRQIYTQHCEPNTVIMHPLPRDSREEAQELDEDLDEHPNLAIFRQTDNGINIRMALFALVMNVVDHIEDSAREVRWHSGVQQHN